MKKSSFAIDFAEKNAGSVLYNQGPKAEGHGWVYPSLLMKGGHLKEPPIVTLSKMKVSEFWLHNIDNMSSVDGLWLEAFGMKIRDRKLLTFEYSMPNPSEKRKGWRRFKCPSQRKNISHSYGKRCSRSGNFGQGSRSFAAGKGCAGFPRA